MVTPVIPVIPEGYVQKMLNALRVTSTELSIEEVTDLIYAAANDINRQGVKVIDLEDPLTKQAVKLYIKANYGYDAEQDRFRVAYEALSAAMALSGDYEEDDPDDG